MAAETYAYNLLNEDLKSLAKEGQPAKKSYWLHSQYPPNQINHRLKESPLEPGAYNDLESNPLKQKGHLVVGDIQTLIAHLKRSPKLLKRLTSGFGKSDITLVSGGPPCQSFSMAGNREYCHERNQLPKAFAKFVELIRPKAVLLENVSGILHAFKIKDKRYYAWLEVAKVFASIGYTPLCLHVNAKYVGVPQSRPRFIMIALRQDVLEQLKTKLNPLEQRLWQEGVDFSHQVQQNQRVSIHDLTCHDLEREPKVFKDSFLKPLLTHTQEQWIGAKEAIGDLSQPPSQYVYQLHKTLSPLQSPPLSNHQEANHTLKVKQRLRLLQVLENISVKAKREVIVFLWNPKAHRPSQATLNELKTYTFLNNQGQWYSYRSNDGIIQHLLRAKGRQKIQRALHPTRPSFTVLGSTSDHCHYKQLRVLTIREKARLQSFPDSFILRSNTYSKKKGDVSQHKQLGNAVPPLLGKALGQCIVHLLAKSTLKPS